MACFQSIFAYFRGLLSLPLEKTTKNSIKTINKVSAEGKSKDTTEFYRKMATDKQIVPGGTSWSEKVGYSRVVRVNNIVEVGGTVSVDDSGAVIGIGDIYKQTQFILKKIEKAMGQVGAKMTDVVRTRLYVTSTVDVSKVWEDIGRAHHEVFAPAILPVCTMVQVHALVAPELLIEIEINAIIQ